MEISVGAELLLSILKERRTYDFFLLNPSFFNNNDKRLYDFIKEYFVNYKDLPSEKIIKKKFKLTFDLVTEPFGYLLDEVTKTYLKEMLGGLIIDIGTLANEDPKKAISYLKNKIFEVENTVSDLRTDVSTLVSLSEELFNEIKESKFSSTIPGIPTGWQTMDKITQGYQKGDIYVYVARVKMGKSACIMYSADKANKAGFVPLIISMEMKIKQFARRHLSLRSGIGYNYFKSKQVSIFAERIIQQTIEQMKQNPDVFYVEGQLKKDVSEIASLIHLYSPHIVFIDGGYLLNVDVYKKSRWEEMEVIMKTIKSLAIRFDIPIVLTFQFKRDMLRKKQVDVGFEDIRLSDDIGAIASVVIGIFDKSPYESDVSEDVISARRYIEILGGREGETGGFYINWDWERMDFSEIPEQPLYDFDLIKKEISTYEIERDLFTE